MTQLADRRDSKSANITTESKGTGVPPMNTVPDGLRVQPVQVGV